MHLKSSIQIFLLLPSSSSSSSSSSCSPPPGGEAPESAVLACGVGRTAGHPGARQHHAGGLRAGSRGAPWGPAVNPSVTLSLLAARKLDLVRALVYVGAQCLGAFLATGALYLALPRKSTAEVFVNRVPADGNAAQAVGMEVLCTFSMVFTIFAVEEQRRRDCTEPGNLGIGLAHTASVMMAVYWIGPVSGGVLAGISHEFFFAHSASRQRLVACLTCKDVDMVETASVSRSSLSTVTQNAGRAKQANKGDGN
ncbi:hypothetical protein CRUP_012103 [Coryphaenoides rupestris]|nr:hypothetical protein CRUP_012103 [Coryphaenoides rupestris]